MLNVLWGGTHSWHHLERARVAYAQGQQIQHDVNLPKSSVAVMHCEGHQKSDTEQETGNTMADRGQNRHLKEKKLVNWL